MPSIKLSALRVSILISVSLFLITLSFKSYFYYVPFSGGFSFLSTMQAITQLGWIALIAAPPLYLSSAGKWSRVKSSSYFACVSLWTAATLIIKIYTFVMFGKVWIDYLIAYPVMIYFEWVIPAFYIWLGIVIGRKASAEHVQSTREARTTAADFL